METIYWLAMFGSIVGIGMFLLSIIGVIATVYYGTPLEKLAIEYQGHLTYLRWNYLIVGIASLITVLTI